MEPSNHDPSIRKLWDKTHEEEYSRLLAARQQHSETSELVSGHGSVRMGGDVAIDEEEAKMITRHSQHSLPAICDIAQISTHVGEGDKREDVQQVVTLNMTSRLFFDSVEIPSHQLERLEYSVAKREFLDNAIFAYQYTTEGLSSAGSGEKVMPAESSLLVVMLKLGNSMIADAILSRVYLSSNELRLVPSAGIGIPLQGTSEEQKGKYGLRRPVSWAYKEYPNTVAYGLPISYLTKTIGTEEYVLGSCCDLFDGQTVLIYRVMSTDPTTGVVTPLLRGEKFRVSMSLSDLTLDVPRDSVVAYATKTKMQAAIYGLSERELLFQLLNEGHTVYLIVLKTVMFSDVNGQRWSKGCAILDIRCVKRRLLPPGIDSF